MNDWLESAHEFVPAFGLAHCSLSTHVRLIKHNITSDIAADIAVNQPVLIGFSLLNQTIA